MLNNNVCSSESSVAIGGFVTQQTPCELCGEQHLRVISLISRTSEALTTAICTGCGLVQSHPLPSDEELQRYYASQYRTDYKGTTRPKRKHIVRYARNAAARLARLRPYVQSGATLLDVGSGSGEFGYACKVAGLNVKGLEPHVSYANYTQNTFGYDVINSPIEHAHVTPESLDVITLHHVLEHMRSPYRTLKTLNQWLSMGGILAVDVPDAESIKHAPNNRYHYAHIYNFNHATLAAFLRKAGFEIVGRSLESGTVLFARKVREANDSLLQPDAANYTHLWKLLAVDATQRTHYASTKPYIRLWQKLKRFGGEYAAALCMRDERDVVEKEVKIIATAAASSSNTRKWLYPAIAAGLYVAIEMVP